ncbi:Domain of uncharacterised function (DUF932) [Nocardia otitidiscaviarum]|uniref:Domain of uncharacterized function (DUF932) n=1 Tax=Nocardia otitidiscaviarum TaxID=1823 RepID=A0A379JMF1_9NOCA|nr:Domain of uncharacterised function (DUF932) [Nocardia otitidiscaviarum]
MPSIFATEPHETRSALYAYIPTVDVLNALQREGFQPFAAAQTRVRNEDRRDFTKHMLRLRHARDIATTEANEIILLNSHDGTSSYQMLAGMFRFVCTNGMVCGDTIEDVRIRHTGKNVIDDVVAGAYSVLENFELVTTERDEMKALPLSSREERAFADAARELRWNSEEKPAPVAATQLLAARRSADNNPDLWSTFNRVQENLIKGGLDGRTRNDRKARTRPVNSVTEDVRLNRALWKLAANMREIKQQG